MNIDPNIKIEIEKLGAGIYFTGMSLLKMFGEKVSQRRKFS